MTTRTSAELAMMTPEEIKAYRENERKNVFGFDYKTDRNGNPVEQGIGAPGHETANHFAALRKREAEGHEEPGTYDAAVAALWERDREHAIKIGLRKPKGKTA